MHALACRAPDALDPCNDHNAYRSRREHRKVGKSTQTLRPAKAMRASSTCQCVNQEAFLSHPFTRPKVWAVVCTWHVRTQQTTEAPRSFLESISVDFSENASLDEDAFDPLRDGPLRFLGYSNEVGEAFGAWLPPGGVPASYALAITYVLVDTYDKGVKAYRRATRELNARDDLDTSIDKEGCVAVL